MSEETPADAPLRLPPVEVEVAPELAAAIEDGRVVYPATAFPAIVFPLPQAEPVLAPPEPESQDEKPPKIWEGSVQLGVDGSSGNDESFNIRLGADVKRKTELRVLTASIDYHKNRSDGDGATNRLKHEARYERLFPETPWTWFTRETFLYDEAQDYDSRVTGDTGIGYKFIDEKDFKFAGRLGGGFSHEFGGPDDELVPELVLGVDYEYQITKRQKLTLTADYKPDVTDPSDYRMESKATWEALLDEEMNLSLKCSVEDQFDSTPHDAKANDIDYSMVLLWKF